jgi:NADH dehydrogenase
MNQNGRAKVVIIGAGFGGLNAAKQLQKAPVEVTIVDRNNYHLFQPLLYQVATAGLSATEIAYPVRTIFRKQKNVKFHMGEVTKVDLAARQVITDAGDLPYDYLILGMGSQNNYYGQESVAKYGFALKELSEARNIRNHILWVFERSTEVPDPEICKAMRTFVIVGGGPTGVECAGALSELIRLVLSKDYHYLSYGDIHVILLEMTGGILSGYPGNLTRKALKMLKDKHVEVRLNTAVTDYDGKQVFLKNGDVIPAYTLIWAAGVKVEEIANQLGFQQARQGRIVVEPTLQVPDYPEIFVIGDAAYMEEKGQMLPMVAPVAIQQAKTAAQNIQHLLKGEPLESFKYHDPGSLATIGRNAAVARVGPFKFSGFIAWVVWLVVHLFWLIGFRNRLVVLINWAWDYVFFDRAVRVITPSPGEETLEGQAFQEAPVPEVPDTVST